MSIDEIRAREIGASEGPWEADGWEVYGPARRWIAETHDPDNIGQCEQDAEFIAHARADVPALLADVERLAAFEAKAENLADTLNAVRRLCQSYTPEPPPLFRGPGLSEHGEGYNHGTRDMAQAILGVLDGEEQS
jgi:hypothetical protein